MNQRWWLSVQQPELVQRLHEEQLAIVAKHGEAVTAQAVAEMSFADAVVRESLRVTSAGASMAPR
jgi:Cytochrome P450